MQKESLIRMQRAWLAALLEERNMTATALAKKSGISVTTLTQFAKEEHGRPFPLSRITIGKICAYLNIPVPYFEGAEEDFMPGKREAPLEERENSVLIHMDNDFFQQGIYRFYKLNSYALSDLGYQPEDCIAVDPSRAPRSGDLVCCQTANKEGRIFFRLYEPPYLLSHTHIRALRRPHLIDPEQISIVGVAMYTIKTIR